MLKIRNITSRSVSLELINNDIYKTKQYSIYLNDRLYASCDKNVFSIFSLTPNTKYFVKVNDDIVSFKTKKESALYNIKDYNVDSLGVADSTEIINKVIKDAKKNSTIIFPSGTYLVTSLFLKSDITLYLDKGAKLIGELNRNKYPILKGTYKGFSLGSFEGEDCDIYASLINILFSENVNVIGEGEIDQRADLSDWYIDHHRIRGAYRPYAFYTNHAKNVNLVGLTIKNSACWNVHPYFSDYINIINVNLYNRSEKPTTDGIDLDAVNHANVLGVNISVGDDCIAIKAFKLLNAKKYKRGSKNITIRNCYMQRGHGGIVLGSELSAGVKNLNLSNCLFEDTDRGLRIKTCRGRGHVGPISNVSFNNIEMNNVNTPFVINSYYNSGTNGRPVAPIVNSHKKELFTELTPILGKFKFENIKVRDAEFSCGEFLGLAESPIEEVTLSNVDISFKENANIGVCDMYQNAEPKSKSGFVFENVKKRNIINVKINGVLGEPYTIIDYRKENNNE